MVDVAFEGDVVALKAGAREVVGELVSQAPDVSVGILFNGYAGSREGAIELFILITECLLKGR